MSGKGVVSMFRRVVDRIRGHAGVVTELDHINLEILATFGQLSLVLTFAKLLSENTAPTRVTFGM